MFGASATAMLLVGMGCALMVSIGGGAWIELFNGATWPERLEPSGFWFFLVLAFRTLVNLGVVLTGGWALVLLLGGGLEGIVMRRMEAVLHGRDTALAGYLIKVMREQQIADLPVDAAKKLMDAAREFPNTPAGKLYQEEAEKASAQ